MTRNKILLLAALAAIIAAAGYYALRPKAAALQEIIAETADFVVTVPAGGTVEPENKISITAPIAGRIDRILHDEGSKVGRAKVIAWMSSTDRAALLDSAQVAGGAELGEWAQVYKPTPILAPANGVIIAKKVVVGQTVTQGTSLFELSDRLVITADVDETDLGKIKIDQLANVTVDSFPGLVVRTRVARIAHQSVTKNSINTYQVLLLPEKLPEELRAGLTANVQFVYAEKKDAVLLPTWVAEGRENVKAELKVKGADGKPVDRSVQFGLSNGTMVEVTEGLKAGETILIKSQTVLGEKPASVFGVGSGPGGGGGRRR